MSTNLIIGILVAIAVVGGGAYVAANPEIMASFTGGGAMQDDEHMSNDEHMEGESASVGSTFAEIVALGQSVQCTFSRDDGAGNTSSGTMYMTAGGAQIRGDFTTMQSGGIPLESHMVRTDGYTYVWSDASPQGVKTKVTNKTELASDTENSGVDENTKFGCQAWSVNNSKFELPDAIQFTDMSAQMEAAVEASSSADVKAQQCAACEQLPTGAKEQCLAALSC